MLTFIVLCVLVTALVLSLAAYLDERERRLYWEDFALRTLAGYEEAAALMAKVQRIHFDPAPVDKPEGQPGTPWAPFRSLRGTTIFPN